MIKDIKVQNENTRPNDGVLRKLHTDFPQCFTKEGKFDLERFQQLIENEVDVTKEGYELNFLGKNYANLIASAETETVIEPDLEHNAQPENANSQNVYISGDNLDALKHLLKSYSGKIKCIYIDPPYNTGSDGFVYNDKFNFTKEQLQTKLSISEEKANRILDLTKRGSASHSAWLMFMAPRLMLAKDLLKEDGVIFISIDDNEQANLKLLCDSVFGEENFICDFVWKKKQGGGNDSAFVVSEHEYIICLSKSISSAKLNVDKKYKLDDSLYPYNDEKGQYGLITLDKASIQFSQSLVYEIAGPDGSKYWPRMVKGKQSCWRWGRQTVEEHYDELVFKNGKVYTKYYKPEGVTPRSLLIDSIYGRTESGNDDISALFDSNPFSYPKPVALINHFASIATSNTDCILDFFSGSGTTAHAVMKLNAEDGGNRKYIMVQLPEPTPKDSESRKSGFETIDQIGQERILRAAKKIKEEHPEYQGDFGFKHYTLQDVPQNTLDKMETFDPNGLYGEEDILVKFGKETVLETWCVKDGYGFGANRAELALANYTAYHCGSHLYFVSGEEFDENTIIALIDRYHGDPSFNPQNIVLFGYSFSYTQVEMLKKNLKTLEDSAKNLKINLDIRY